MSFYVYYGKLENELLVAVLPNGTVEHGDPIHLYSKKKFSSYNAKNVSINDDGEDVVAFSDAYYTYEAVSKKAYKELALSVKGGDAKASKVTLTRHYDQPLTAIPLSDPPRIWTGVIDFHKWAKNESFFVITPKGLGNGKPVVAIWQWTEDAHGTKDTLSYSTSKQQSEAATPTAFSFKQNDYYTLNCKINAATNGLNVTVKSPSNPDSVLKELKLSAKIEIGAEHSFNPPRSSQKQITLDCSLPRAAPSLPRITGALPFPADLVETLAHSAAYVDQAGYLAKYAVKQFDQLDRSFHQLEKKAELRAAKIVALEGDVSKLNEANRVLKGQNSELQKQLEDNRVAAAKREADLLKKLEDALNALSASEGRERTKAAKIKKLEAYIDADKLADIAREEQHRKHDIEDHKAIDLANDLLEKSRKAEQKLQEKLDQKNKEIAGLTATVDSLRKQVCDKDALIAKLTLERNGLKKDKAELELKLGNEIHLHDTAKSDLLTAQEEIARLGRVIKRKDQDFTKKQTELNGVEESYKDVERKWRSASDDLEKKQKEFDDFETESESRIQKVRDELQKFKDHDKTHHTNTPAKAVDIAVPKAPVTATVTEIVN